MYTHTHTDAHRLRTTLFCGFTVTRSPSSTSDNDRPASGLSTLSKVLNFKTLQP